MDTFLAAFTLLLRWNVLLPMLGAGAFGLFVGATPGLSASMAVALLVPVTYFMDPVPALAMITSLAAMAIFAGDLPGAFLRIPGTPASAAYCDLSYGLVQKGKGGIVLGAALFASALGGCVGVILLSTSAPLLAELALKFSTFEYFWLTSLGLLCAVMISAQSNLLKGLISLFLGISLSFIGLDPVFGQPRFIMNVSDLRGGVGFIPLLIGLFAFSQVLRYAANPAGDQSRPPTTGLRVRWKDVMHHFGFLRFTWLRGSLIGTLVGAVPGAGADIAAYISFASQRRGRHHDEQNDIASIVAASSSNNAAIAGAFIPALVFGIPGDSLSAIVIGVLQMKGLRPGPTIFQQQPQEIVALGIAFLLSNILLIPLGLLAIRSFAVLLRFPKYFLMPIVGVFCIVGAYAVENTLFSIAVVVVTGLLGYAMEKHGFPLSPCILGFVLAPLLEKSFISSLLKTEGHLLPFITRPVSAILAAIFFGFIVLRMVLSLIHAGRKRSKERLM